ncbi:MAG TPA: DUF4214 domain-containing protein [Gemmataceae bacterium]|nr:DUF4214 domain-containing protein [Gemmataceae bacterium]
MSIRVIFKNLLHKSAPRSSSRSVRRQSNLQLEALETRLVPYSISGDAWPSPQLITLSFMPDGTNMGGVQSNLFATFNAKFGTPSVWQNQFLKAAQVWAQQTNINFAVVPDSGADVGSGNYQQGDPSMGDIRIGAFNFGSSTLAMAYMPPPADNYSLAGDIAFDSGQVFNINQTFDLFTVAAHEIGHSLGLYESSLTSAVMYQTYLSKFTALGSDDISGIRSIYGGARSYDAFGGTNNSLANATNLTGLIDSNSTVLETGLDITNTSQKEYFTITAPATTTGTMTVSVQSSGLSLLSPSLTVYNSSQTQVGYVSGAGQYGTTLTLNITGVTPGQQFYVKVGGADTTAFSTGHYALTFAFAGIAPQPVPLPNTQVLNGSPISGSGGQAMNRLLVQGAVAQEGNNSQGNNSQGNNSQAGPASGGDAGDVLQSAAGQFDFMEPGSPNQMFVAQAYQDLLDRPVDSSGLQSWSGALDAGTLTRNQVVQGIENSLEGRTLAVNNAYQQILGRQADTNGLNNFVQFLQNGGTLQQLNAILASSPEFQNDAQAQNTTTGLTTANEKTVDFLFQKVLDRTADSSGLASFSTALDNGTTPLMVASAVVFSAEADADLVNGFYTRFLKRSADSAGLQQFTQALGNGGDVEAVVAGIVGSNEYFGLTQAPSQS